MVGGDVTSLVFETGRPGRIDDYADGSGPATDLARELGVRTSVGVPISVEGRLGAVVVASRRALLPADTEARLAGFTELVATAIANAEARAALTASRTRIVAAADQTRRRIERDLHDGTQQRLVSLGLELRLAQSLVPAGLPKLETQTGRVADELAGWWRICGRSPGASIRRSCPKAGWARPCGRWPAGPRSWSSSMSP